MTMNRATFLTTLAGGALALPHLTAEETAAEKAIYDLLDAVVDSQFTYDFERLVKLLHPDSTEQFRNHLSARFDQLLKSYSLDEIVSVSGLSNHPKDINASDAEIMVAACNSAKERHPKFVGDPKYLPLKIHGTVFDHESLAYVLYSYSGAIHTERTDYDFFAPRVFMARREGDAWLVHSCLLAGSVMDGWWRDLAKRRRAEQKPK
jgi:hypothetical protein